MKILTFAVGLLCFGACSGPGDGKPLSDYSGASQADSLSYFYGAMYADNYWRMSANDSAAKAEAARKKYLEGVAKGIGLGSDDKQYNEGLLVGLQFATGMKELEDELGVRLDKDVILNAMAYGLESDSTIDAAATQQGLQKILQALGEKKDKKDAAEADKAVAAAAKKSGMKLMAAGLYGKTLKPGTGPLLKEDDVVKVDMSMASLSGKEVAFPMPSELRVGTEFKGSPLGEALTKIHAQESVELYVSTFSMFGRNCGRMGFEPNDVIKVSLTTLGLQSGSGQPVKAE